MVGLTRYDLPVSASGHGKDRQAPWESKARLEGGGKMPVSAVTVPRGAGRGGETRPAARQEVQAAPKRLRGQGTREAKSPRPRVVVAWGRGWPFGGVRQLRVRSCWWPVCCSAVCCVPPHEHLARHPRTHTHTHSMHATRNLSMGVTLPSRP